MPSRVDDLLRGRKAEIAEAWAAEVRRNLPEAERASRPALADEIPAILDRLADEMSRSEAPSGAGISRACRRRTERRVPEALPPSRVIDEYRILRRVILSLLSAEKDRSLGAVTAEELRRCTEDLVRLDVAIDDALSGFISGYLDAHESHLTALEHRLRLALESAAIGTWDLDVPSGVFTWDPRCRDIFGLPNQSEGAYDRFIAAVHPEDRDRVAEAAAASLSGKHGGEYRAEYRIHRGDDGAVRWVNARGAALFDAAGAPVRFVGTVVDVTDAKAAEEMRDRFIGMLGHDLRSPLGTISMAATHILRSEGLPEGIERSASVIARTAERMGRMIRDLLDLARGRLGGTLALSPGPVDLGELCRSVIDEIRVVHPARTIQLACEGDLAGVWDGDRLVQALSNLVGNAIAHGRDPIVVRACGAPDAATVDVSNAGPAIPAHERAHLFEPFRPRKGTRTRAGSGLRLGLYIVSEIAAAHGGTVDVRSDEAQTTFTLRLPRST